jgi:indole-3-glycerol phosphate synthase
MGRFIQAIAEGDGISIVPLLEGDVAELAALAEEAGAEAVAVRTADEVESARSQTALPVLVREPHLELSDELRFLRAPDADACTVSFDALSDEGVLESVYAVLRGQGIDCVVEVRDEEQLEEALERIDPEIILISERETDHDWEELERTLDLLPDVPAGKLVISEAQIAAREQVVALERAGVDAILVGGDFLRHSPDFASALAELTGR